MSLRDRAKPGDLLFYNVTPASSLLARAIAAMQLMRGEGRESVQYSHVAILEADKDRCIEARWPRVRYSQVDWGDDSMEVWRVRGGQGKAYRALLSARHMVGQWYDIAGLIMGNLGSWHRKICTTLVAKAFWYPGIILGAGAGEILTPNELAADPHLYRIGNVRGRKKKV